MLEVRSCSVSAALVGCPACPAEGSVGSCIRNEPSPEGDALDRQMQDSTAQAVGCTWSSAASWRISAAGYRRWPPRVFRNSSLPSLAQRDTVLGDTCRMSATSAVWRYLGVSGAALPLGWAATAHPFRAANPMVCRAEMERAFVRHDSRGLASNDAGASPL